MNPRLTFRVLGGLLLFLGALLLAPIPFSLYYGDGQVLCFAGSAAATGLVGGLLFGLLRSREEMTARDGFVIVTCGWLAYALFGALPYLCSGSLASPVDAFFEAMSGFTTTGASVLRDVEVVPKSVLFWRALTQWVGGMGIIVLSIALFPLLDVGGKKLYEAEAPGPTADRLTPRIQDTARLLWTVYAGITLAGAALLWAGDMSLLDALCHSFTAVATGGFSTRNASLGAFNSYSQVVAIVLMFLGGVNFSLHYFALRGNLRKYWQSQEFLAYVIMLGGVVLVLIAVNWSRYGNPLLNLRDAAFTATSVLTTTGFATADYESWPVLAQGLLFAAMFVGGCTGSTGGGLKQVRIVLLVKHAFLEVASLIHPYRVRALKLDGKPISAEVMRDVLGFTVLFMGGFVVSSLILTAEGVDLITASSATIACLSSVGPGLGGVGPMDNFASMPTLGKLVLSSAMLLGRLEFYTVLVLFFPSFWKK